MKKKNSFTLKPFRTVQEKQQRLLHFYNLPIFLRFQHNNLFISFFNLASQTLNHQSVGQLLDYKKKKKKKKTYIFPDIDMFW